jgi:3-deoxy-D-manno-octulosonic-acid transferase
MRFLVDILYLLGLIGASPVWAYRMLRHRRYLDQPAARLLGSVPVRYGKQPIIWIHGVSLGEVNAARMLVDELHRQLPDYQVVISSTTDTGMSAAKRLFEPEHWVFQWPIDFSWAVARALGRLRPSMVVLMEGEAWPNFLGACKRRGIPTVIVNGRLGASKGYPRYKKMGPLARALFGKLTAVGAQTEPYAEMFRTLGVPAEGVHVTGMLKYDTAQTSLPEQDKATLAAALGLYSDSRLVVAGGTGDGEEAMVLAQWKAIREAHPNARLAIVPRKPERFDEVARLIAREGFSVLRRSEANAATAHDPNAIILGDTMGELKTFYALAEVIFVGRSLVPMGGSDMIEAAALGKPVAFGPHTFNFPQAEDLVEHGCVCVSGGDELGRVLSGWLADPQSAASAGKGAQAFVVSQQGATKRNVDMLCGLLGRTPAIAAGTVATDAIHS